MNVLDPFEVAEICVWPLDLSKVPEAERRAYLDRAEYTLFQKVVSESKLGAVLNEKPPAQSKTIQLPPCHRRRIIPDSIYPQRKHPDVRIARRASTIARLRLRPGILRGRVSSDSACGYEGGRGENGEG